MTQERVYEILHQIWCREHGRTLTDLTVRFADGSETVVWQGGKRVLAEGAGHPLIQRQERGVIGC